VTINDDYLLCFDVIRNVALIIYASSLVTSACAMTAAPTDQKEFEGLFLDYHNKYLNDASHDW
jgi:hypothetical protein